MKWIRAFQAVSPYLPFGLIELVNDGYKFYKREPLKNDVFIVTKSLLFKMSKLNH